MKKEYLYQKLCKETGIFILVLILIMLSVPSAKVSAINWTPPSGYSLVFSDDFNNANINFNKWGYRYTRNSLPANVSIDLNEGYDGALKLKMTKEDNGYGGAGLITKQPFGYGYYEVRAKLYNGIGWHPAFWTKAYNEEGNLYPSFNAAFTELDFFENKEQPNYFDVGWIRWKSSNMFGITNYVGTRASYIGDTTQYHIYKCYYTPTKITWYIDDTKVHEQTITGTNQAASNYVPNSPMHVILSVIQATADPVPDPTKPTGYVYGACYFDYFKYCTYDLGYPHFFTPAEVFESENVYTGLSSTELSYTDHSDTLASNGTYRLARLANIGDYVRFKPNIMKTGKYYLQVRTRTWSNRAIFQTAYDTDGLNNNYTNIGNLIDTYDPDGSAGYKVINIGPLEFDTTGTKNIKFTVVGKNAASSGYYGGFDCLYLYPQEIVVDNSDAGFYRSASGWATSGLTGYNGSTTLFCNAAGAWAKWVPNLMMSGNYKVEFYKIANAVGDTNATLQLCNGDGSVITSMNIDFTQSSSGWITLENYINLNAQSGVYVKLIRGDGYIRADAVRFTKR